MKYFLVLCMLSLSMTTSAYGQYPLPPLDQNFGRPEYLKVDITDADLVAEYNKLNKHQQSYIWCCLYAYESLEINQKMEIGDYGVFLPEKGPRVIQILGRNDMLASDMRITGVDTSKYVSDEKIELSNLVFKRFENYTYDTASGGTRTIMHIEACNVHSLDELWSKMNRAKPVKSKYRTWTLKNKSTFEGMYMAYSEEGSKKRVKFQLNDEKKSIKVVPLNSLPDEELEWIEKHDPRIKKPLRTSK